METLLNTVVITANDWHDICHRLKFDAVDRKEEFEKYFNCTVTWKSRLQEWDGDPNTRPEPVMILRFFDPRDATIFGLTWAC